VTDVSLPASIRSGSGPLVSVIVPTYGDAAYLDGAIESIAAQSHDNLEIVLVDGSGVEWLARLGADVEGVTYLHQEPRGLAAARNRGLDAASGELVAFLDADDRWHPAKLDRQLAAIDAGADVVYSDAYVLERTRRRYHTSLPVRDPERHHVDFLLEGGVPVPTVIARRECLAAERFEESLPAVEDRHLLARLFGLYRPARIPEPLAYYRRREGSMSSDAELMYESELASLADLFERFPALDAHRGALERRAEYAYGKRLLRTSRAAEARRVLLDVLRERPEHRALALFGVSLLPAGHRRALGMLESAQERFG
jgi:glycosyltransferase involved in cell wall biosynthesis